MNAVTELLENQRYIKHFKVKKEQRQLKEEKHRNTCSKQKTREQNIKTERDFLNSNILFHLLE
jgi:hypothetical protein